MFSKQSWSESVIFQLDHQRYYLPTPTSLMCAKFNKKKTNSLMKYELILRDPFPHNLMVTSPKTSVKWVSYYTRMYEFVVIVERWFVH
jgi:hypothetical protein